MRADFPALKRCASPFVSETLHAALVAAWSQPHRRYHTPQHLAECLQHLDAARGEAAHPDEVELALWFHDAVYEIGRGDNEERSADWARAALLEGGAPVDLAGRVHALVMATKHGHGRAPGVEADPRDEALLLDIDLSILGAAPERFDEYERQITEEYAAVPAAVRRVRRKALLESFLRRDRLYATQHFHSLCEAQARENLAQSIRRLSD